MILILSLQPVVPIRLVSCDSYSPFDGCEIVHQLEMFKSGIIRTEERYQSTSSHLSEGENHTKNLVN